MVKRTPRPVYLSPAQRRALYAVAYETVQPPKTIRVGRKQFVRWVIGSRDATRPMIAIGRARCIRWSWSEPPRVTMLGIVSLWNPTPKPQNGAA